MRTMSKVGLALVLVFGLLGVPAVEADSGPGDEPDPELITWEGEMEASPTSGYSPLNVTVDASGATHPDPERQIVGYWWASLSIGREDIIGEWQYSADPVRSITLREPGLWGVAAVAVDDLGGQGLLFSPVVCVPFRDLGELEVHADTGSPDTVVFDASGASHPDPERHFVEYWWTFDPELMIPDDYGTEQAEDPFWVFDLSLPGWQHTTEPYIEHTFEPGLARAQLVLIDDQGGYSLMEGATQVWNTAEVFEVTFGPLTFFSSLSSTRPYWAEVTSDSVGPSTIVALAAPDYPLSSNITISTIGLAAQRVGAGPSYAGFLRFGSDSAGYFDIPFVGQVDVGNDGVVTGWFPYRISLGWISFDIPVIWRVNDGD